MPGNGEGQGQPIAHQGQPCRNLLLLTEGSAYARMTSNDGRELTLETLSAPEVLASPFLFSTQGTYPVTIIADSACHIRPLGRERVERLLAASPTVRQNLLRIISDHTVFLNSRISEFASPTFDHSLFKFDEDTDDDFDFDFDSFDKKFSDTKPDETPKEEPKEAPKPAPAKSKNNQKGTNYNY